MTDTPGYYLGRIIIGFNLLYVPYPVIPPLCTPNRNSDTGNTRIPIPDAAIVGIEDPIRSSPFHHLHAVADPRL
ncbi:hypothetical protein N7510_003459 [Penicillium lagena]|uniref:uncharacterized protein n=1 Tax=Penicillium lagena TaxID=94218 RepID=UPI00253FA9F3|nr:uncharacterized protein N7510_003459 [Penicillium lagena]KAJ5619475.1 hypothetical protein N7510_003459 [Penicillium lagena]